MNARLRIAAALMAGLALTTPALARDAAVSTDARAQDAGLSRNSQPQRPAAASPAPDGQTARDQAADDRQGTQDPATDDAAEQDRDPQVRDVRFIFVEGSLPWIPGANTIVAKLPLALRATPFHVGIVTGPLFREQDARVLSDALVNVSNVNVQPGFGGVHDFFLIRGFDSLSSGLVLTDGAAEPEVTFYELYNVELVEVLKGPAGFLYGSNPLAGAVNLVRKQPAPSTMTSASVSAGRFDAYEGSVDFNWAGDDDVWSFRLNGMFRDRGGYRDRVESRTAAVNPTFAWNIDEDASLNVGFELLDADYMPDIGLPVTGAEVPDVPRTRNYQAPFDDSRQDVYRFQTDYQNRLSDAVTVRNKLYYRELEWDSAGTLFNGVFPVPQFDDVGNIIGVREEISRNLLMLDDHQRFLGNQLEAVVQVDTGGISHHLMAGFELARFADEFTLDVAALPNIDLRDPVETAAEPLFLIPGQSAAGDSRSLVVAPYLVDQISFSDRLQVLVGGRVDRIDFDDEINPVAREDTKVSPMLGAVFAPHEDVSLFANFSRSFAPPVARVQDGTRVPEEGEQVEAGVKADLLDGRGRLTAAVYSIDRENIAIVDDNGFTQQVGNQRSRGFEIELAAEPATGLRAVANYAYNDAELTRFTEQIIDFTVFPPAPRIVDRSGNRPAFVPEHLANFWVSKTFPQDFGVGFGGTWRSEQFIAEDNVFVIDDVLTFDATAFYSWEELRFDLSVKNLTDREYVTRSFGGTSVIPADPVTVYFGVGFRM